MIFFITFRFFYNFAYNICYRFPKDPVRREAWVMFVGRGTWQPKKHSVLCSKHFAECCFDRTSKSLVRLKPEAIPSINKLVGKIQILSNLIIRPASITKPIPSMSSASPTPAIQDVVSPASLSTTIITDPNPTATDCSQIMSPRKRKLLQKLQYSETVSARRKRKVILLRKKIARKDKRISSMKAIIDDLQNRKLLEEESLDLISKLGGPQELYFRQYQKNCKKALPIKYSEDLKVFALTLHYYSPAAYKYVRRAFNTCLPHTRTISRWYQSLNGLPGFTTEAFNALHLKASASKDKVVCALVMDEMAIRQHEEFVPSQCKSYGYVDMGTGAKETTIAKESLVFLLNCVNGNWKIPVGYFLIAGIRADQKKELVLECLRKCNDAGITVVSLTFDGAPTNLTMSKRLGCDLQHTSLKTSFKHPSCDEEVFVFLDPCHMIKLIRNTLGEKFSFINADNKLIEWKYFKQLHQLQESESFHLANKLRVQHIDFKKQKMKVRFATQLFSESVAMALKFCSENLLLADFKDVGPTVEFIQIVNHLFDILNSRNLLHFGFKKPLTKYNFHTVNEFIDKADKYISSLKTHVNGPLLLDSLRHTGFLGLKVCIFSLKQLFTTLVIRKKILKFLPMYKFSQDHLELFFAQFEPREDLTIIPLLDNFSQHTKNCFFM